MRRFVEAAFDSYVRKTFNEKRPEVCKFILEHEKKSSCIDNICEKFVESKITPNTTPPKTFIGLVQDITRIFIKAALDDIHVKTEKATVDVANEALENEVSS